jgi:phosphatidylethanolamine-binding protein (PEBP) family uncharacterized protein
MWKHATLVMAAMAFCSTAQAQGGAFAVTPSWDGITKCSGMPVSSPSPKFRVANVPAGTTQLDFALKDIDAPMFNHGGGKVAYSGGAEIAVGAFKFTGPCPPGTHRYEWTITARDAGGKSLGSTRAAIKYP